MKIIWIILIILLLPTSTFNAFGQFTAVDDFNTFIISNSCFFRSDTKGCFENQKIRVRRKGGRLVNISHVYRYKLYNELPSKPLYPHFLMEYLKKLRNAVDSGETGCLNIDSSGKIRLNYDCLSLLLDQLQYMESEADTSNNLIVWKQGTDYPMAMVQAEIAYMYSNLASTLKNKGHDASARELFEKSKRIAATLDIQQTKLNGGVRSRIFNAAGLRGWLYHSSERDGQDFAINQQAHVIRDAIFYYYQHQIFLDSIGEQMSDNTRRQLINRFLIPLQILAADAHPSIPTLTKYMDRVAKQGFSYYWSYYKLDAETLQGENIAANNVCHYHKHTLDMFYGIYASFKIRPIKVSRSGLYNFLNTETNRFHLEMLEQVNETFDALFDARRGPRGQRQIEAIGKEMTNNALFQFFLSETTPRAKESMQKCTHNDLSEDIIKNYRTLLFNLD